MPGLGVFILDMFMLDVLVSAVSGVMFGVFLSHVRGEFRPVGSASGLDLLDFLFGEFRDCGGGCSLGTFVRLFFRLFFFEFGSADDGIGFRFF
jgi:hypothetical protein